MESIHYFDLWKGWGQNITCWRNGPSWLVTNGGGVGQGLTAGQGPGHSCGGVACGHCHTHSGDGRRQSSAPCLPINPNVGNARQDRVVPGASGKWCQPICMAGFTAGGRVKKGVKETHGKIIWSGRCLQHICDPGVSLQPSGVWLHYCLPLPLPPPPVFICSL